MKTGVVFPQLEIGTDPFVIRDFAQAVEGMGFDYLTIFDHVIGADPTNRPGWDKMTGPYTHEDVFYEPLTLISYLAPVTSTLEFSTSILILPQRQTALFAKQAACADIFCNGRMRIGVGTGWNPVEYEVLGVPFEKRGKRLNQQLECINKLWTSYSVTHKDDYHDIFEAGINPLPSQGTIPIWVGGIAKVALKRAAKVGQGFVAPPLYTRDEAEEKVGEFYEIADEVGRPRDEVGYESLIFVGTTAGGEARDADEGALDHAAWKKAGASHASISTMSAGLNTVDDHIEFLRRYKEAVS